MKKQVLRLLALYQDYRALRPAACRFQPTCSTYAHEAIELHGVSRGTLLAVRRVGRCHPLGSHGHDPVPAPTMSPLTASLSKETL